MCITGAHKVEVATVTAYRVYKRNAWGQLVSYFFREPKPMHGIWIKKRDNKWSAWSSLEHAKEFCYRDYWHTKDLRVYQVQLRGNIKKGSWSGSSSLQQYTADECKIIKRVKI
jgi:hypothetical protein